ncbi:MAG: redox-sensing transcriptional repressor Rex [Deltaproteobacteria bacterium RBG_13_43_22]|nr:MAG: redox-sensing transcriptional repressor Rex [Deltaproteobacteria bacterium RBG_13_43_22]
MKFSKIPTATITRLSRYSRALEELEKQRVNVISSEKLARYCEVNSAQIRKDLAYFGEFGVRGVGYVIKELLFEIKRILGLNKVWHLGIIGMGNMGYALIDHSNFPRQGYHFVAAFDNDPRKIGKMLSQGFPISPMSELEEIALERNIEIAVIATPADKAQEVANLVTRTPIRGILNFAPIQLHVPEGFIVHHIDFTVKLDRLAYLLGNMDAESPKSSTMKSPWISKHLL